MLHHHSLSIFTKMSFAGLRNLWKLNINLNADKTRARTEWYMKKLVHVTIITKMVRSTLNILTLKVALAVNFTKLTGHNLVCKHLTLIGIKQSPICVLCNQLEQKHQSIY